MITANCSCLQAGHQEASARGLTSRAPGARQNLNRSQKEIVVQAITVRDRAAGAVGLTLSDIPHPHAAENDVIVRVYAAGFTPGELDWPGTWTDRAGRDSTPSVPGHELSGVVSQLGYGTTGLTVGQRVFGLADWTRDGALAEYTAVEARNLRPDKVPARRHHAAVTARRQRVPEACRAKARARPPGTRRTPAGIIGSAR